MLTYRVLIDDGNDKGGDLAIPYDTQPTESDMERYEEADWMYVGLYEESTSERAIDMAYAALGEFEDTEWEGKVKFEDGKYSLI